MKLIDKSSGLSYDDIKYCTDRQQMIEWKDRLLIDRIGLVHKIENETGDATCDADSLKRKTQALRFKDVFIEMIRDRLNHLSEQFDY